MTHVSRPLIALLVATVLVFALYTVALKPGASSGGGGSHAGAYQSAIAKARAVQGVVNGAGARDGGSPTSTITPNTPSASATSTKTASSGTPTTKAQAAKPSSSTAPAKGTNGKSAASSGSTAAAGATTTGAPKNTAKPSPGATPAARRFATVQAALDHHKVLALLFYNPDSPDDQAVEAELKSIPTQGGAVVKLAVPLQELASYASLLSSVPVNFSPTLVLIDRQRQAQQITGFATSFEIDRRVADALGS